MPHKHSIQRITLTKHKPYLVLLANCLFFLLGVSYSCHRAQSAPERHELIRPCVTVIDEILSCFRVGKISVHRELITFPVEKHVYLWQTEEGFQAIPLLEGIDPLSDLLSLHRTHYLVTIGRTWAEVPENRHF